MINLDCVIGVERTTTHLRVITTTSGVIFEIRDQKNERSFLDALGRWWALLDRIANEQVAEDAEDAEDAETEAQAQARLQRRMDDESEEDR